MHRQATDQLPAVGGKWDGKGHNSVFGVMDDTSEWNGSGPNVIVSYYFMHAALGILLHQKQSRNKVNGI